MAGAYALVHGRKRLGSEPMVDNAPLYALRSIHLHNFHVALLLLWIHALGCCLGLSQLPAAAQAANCCPAHITLPPPPSLRCQGFGEDFVNLDAQRTGDSLYLHLSWTRVPLLPAAEEDPTPDASGKPSKLALGTEGGFALDAPKKYDLEKSAALVVLGSTEGSRTSVPLPCPELPELVLDVISALLTHEGASKQEAVAAWEEERRVSRCSSSSSAPCHVLSDCCALVRMGGGCGPNQSMHGQPKLPPPPPPPLYTPTQQSHSSSCHAVHAVRCMLARYPGMPRSWCSWTLGVR